MLKTCTAEVLPNCLITKPRENYNT